MFTEPLDAVPLLPLLAFATALLSLALEGGYRFGRWRKSHAADEREQPVGAMVASILGLVALVLGFTFSLVANRFDARRMGVLEEANAVGTAYLRTSFLPESEAGESARLLREYVATRIEAVRTPSNLEQSIARSEALHMSLWHEANRATSRRPNSIAIGLYIQSLNQVIDLHATRLHALRSRMPLVLWLAMCFLSTLGMAAVGYQSALAATQRSPAMIALILAFTTVLYLIADLDRSQEGLLRVSQQPLYDLQRSMQGSSP
jgi:hypothetical protein